MTKIQKLWNELKSYTKIDFLTELYKTYDELIWEEVNFIVRVLNRTKNIDLSTEDPYGYSYGYSREVSIYLALGGHMKSISWPILNYPVIPFGITTFYKGAWCSKSSSSQSSSIKALKWMLPDEEFSEDFCSTLVEFKKRRSKVYRDWELAFGKDADLTKKRLGLRCKIENEVDCIIDQIYPSFKKDIKKTFGNEVNSDYSLKAIWAHHPKFLITLKFPIKRQSYGVYCKYSGYGLGREIKRFDLDEDPKDVVAWMTSDEAQGLIAMQVFGEQ